MADFPFVQMTARGLELQAKAQTGQALKFLRVELGDGAAPPDVSVLTGLVNSLQHLPIIGKKTPGNGTAELLVVLTNQGLATGFFMRELGVIVEDPDTGEEVLYSYTNAGMYGDYMPAYGGASIVEQTFNLITVIGNASNVTAIINDSLTYALKKDFLAILPRLLPTGGTVGQLLRKRSNAEGDYEHFDPVLDGFKVNLGSVEEPRVAVANQRTFTLQKTVTSGLAVYIGSLDANGVANALFSRLHRDGWTPLSDKQLKLVAPLAAGTPVLFVNNEETGAGAAVVIPIEGPTLVYPGSTNTFTIGAYDSFSPYTQSATSGTLTRSGKTLSLVIPSNAAPGTVDIEVSRNGVTETRRVAVGAAAIAKPQIVSPTPGAAGVGFEPDLSIAPFTVYPAGYDVLRKTRWQVALDAAFTQMVYNAESSVNLTSINLGAVGVRLEPSRQYFTRAQCMGDTLTSVMSDAVAFNTAAVYIRRPAITSPADGKVGVSPSAVLKSDAFSVYGGADTHKASRWQYSTVADFSTIAIDSGWVTDQLDSYKPAGGLARKVAYYSRVKYKGEVLGESEWSPVIHFTTADKLNGVYTSLAPGATPRRNAGMVALGDYIYMLGGANADFMADFWRYDPAKNTWQQMAYPGYHQGAQMVVLLGKIYIFSGYGNYSDMYTTMYCYDPVLNSWSEVVPAAASPIPAQRVWHSVVAINNKMYIVGGTLSSYYASSEAWVFDPVARMWSALAPDAPARSTAAYGVIDGELYVGLGSSVEGYQSRLAKYNPATNKWTALAPFPFGTLSEFRSAAVLGRLYVWGGSDNTGAVVGNLYEYDPQTNTWAQLTGAASRAKISAAACEYNGKMYVFGGTTGGNSFTNTLFSIE